jgi:hypothetical protein
MVDANSIASLVLLPKKVVEWRDGQSGIGVFLDQLLHAPINILWKGKRRRTLQEDGQFGVVSFCLFQVIEHME